MAFNSHTNGNQLVEMNVTPLVDVMLVLLIIFMVTTPAMSYPIDVTLPQATPPKARPIDPPEPINLRIDQSGEIFWNDNPTPVSALFNMMQAEVEKSPSNQPTLEIDVNADADYAVLTKVLALAKNAQMEKIGFVKKQ